MHSTQAPSHQQKGSTHGTHKHLLPTQTLTCTYLCAVQACCDAHHALPDVRAQRCQPVLNLTSQPATSTHAAQTRVTRACTHTHTRTHAHTHTRTHTQARTHERTHTHARTHTHTCTHTHARTHARGWHRTLTRRVSLCSHPRQTQPRPRASQSQCSRQQSGSSAQLHPHVITACVCVCLRACVLAGRARREGKEDWPIMLIMIGWT